jgi:hypothetical protein
LTLAFILVALACAAALSAPLLLPRLFFVRQDGFVIAGLVGLLFGAGASQPYRWDRRLTAVTLDYRRVVLGAAAAALLLWAGTYVLFDNYPLTRDEHMVVFDAAVFRSGRLAAPLPPEWRAYAVALTPDFLLRLSGNAAWVSSYMPVNAMMRTLFGTIADPALMNPLLAAGGAVATFDCARRLFPKSPGAQAVALLMVATSAQVLVTAMTPYAMTGHLALNMVWLSLYLRGTRASHAGAIAIGFLAIGLHQVIFHPLFALPFIDHLRRQGQWRIAAAYCASYAAFGLFWISYPHLVALSAGVQSATGTSAGGTAFIAERVLPLLLNRNHQTVQLMIANIVRFVTWENLALLPLMALSLGAIRRNEGIARPLAYGIVLTILAMAFLLPFQGHGWGYRYLHGLIGNCALLAAWGWRDHSSREEVRAFVRTASLATVFGSLPFLVWQSVAFARPYARTDQMIARIDADMVVINADYSDFRIDQVRNLPDLTNRPIRLASHMLTPADIRALCSRGRIAFVDPSPIDLHDLEVGQVRDSSDFQRLRAAAPAQCVR